MASTAQDMLEQVLEKGGFIQDGQMSSGLINAEIARTNATTDLRYRHLFNVSGKDGSVIDLVYEVPSQSSDIPGTPSIYFKLIEEPEPSSETIKNLRSLVWNQGHAPTLWLVTPTSVLIYNSYARPQKGDDEKSHLLEELKQIGGQVKLLDEFYKRNFDTGDFWQSKYGKKIDKRQRVDMAMLADLTATEEVLIRELHLSRPGLPSSACVSIAHALLGRVIFVSYLVDRGLLDSRFFRKEYNCSSFYELLGDQEATYTFFGWLRKTFNGDLFPFEKDEQKLVEQSHLQVVKEFLSGSDIKSYSKSNIAYQRRFWPYKFDFIPIELISSIYENFAHARNSSASEASSVHYTHLPLVELTLSLTMRDIPHTAKVLDPACGSGIFLVEAFRRLVWIRENKYGQPVKRNELHEMLRSQIFGIDIDRDAVHVTAFSLYLALLELDPDPQPLEALKFPLLTYNPLSHQLPNLYIQDFCNSEHLFNQSEPFVSKGFDLIVGNPPWTALEKKTAPRDPDNPESGRQWGLEYCKELKIPDNKPDQAFMLRVSDFVQEDTRIAFIVCSRLFYQQQDPSWLDTFLTNVVVETVVNLSDLVGEGILFGGNSSSSTQLPASIIVYRIATPPADNKVMYITPKWYLNANKRDEIIITAQDIHHLSQKLLREQPFLWKSAFRGTARDYRLLNRLQSLSSLNIVLSNIGVKELSHVGVTYGRGAQKLTPPDLIGKPYLASSSDARYSIDVTPLPLFGRETIAKKSNTKYLNLPALVLWRSLKEERPCVALAEGSDGRHNLVINKAYYGIPLLGISPPTLIYRLNAILNSKLAFYMAFMFSSALGWDRHLIEPVDWLQVRLPDSILNETDSGWVEILQREQWLREHWQTDTNTSASLRHEIAVKQEKLNQAIFQLYGLSEQEILLVEDTVQYGIKPILTKQLRTLNALAKATTNDLQTYAQRMCMQLDSILHYGSSELVATVIEFSQQLPLHVCRFTQKNLGNNKKVTVVRLNDIDDIIDQIAENLRTAIADHIYVQRSLHIYENDGFWIIKGAEQRLWCESAALNDADVVVREHMEAMVD